MGACRLEPCRLQIIKVADTPGRVHVLAEDSTGARCLSVRAATTLCELAQAFHADCDQLNVLGLDCTRKDAPLSLRNGDVIVDSSSYTPRDSIWPALREAQPVVDPAVSSVVPRLANNGLWRMSVFLGLCHWTAGRQREPSSSRSYLGVAGHSVVGRIRVVALKAAVAAYHIGFCTLLRDAGRVGCLLATLVTSVTATRSRSPRSPTRGELYEDTFHRLGRWRPDREHPMRDAVRGIARATIRSSARIGAGVTRHAAGGIPLGIH